MTKVKLRILIVFLVLSAVSLACEFSASTANIKEAYLASDEEGTNRTEVFGQDEPFYCIVQVANAPDDTSVKAVWYAVEVTDTEPNLLIDEYSVTTGDGAIPFSLTNNGPWPTGTYKVEIYLNDELNKTIEFTVQ
ncbi:MAG: hypothetical protein LLG42_03080 [Chloroflexi bacterium]|nr:hypothetical protein [Chloroflexota bacterium]